VKEGKLITPALYSLSNVANGLPMSTYSAHWIHQLLSWWMLQW